MIKYKLINNNNQNVFYNSVNNFLKTLHVIEKIIQINFSEINNKNNTICYFCHVIYEDKNEHISSENN